MFTKSPLRIVGVAFLLILVVQVSSLHYEQHKQAVEDSQYTKLNQQQKSLEDQIGSLLEEINKVQKNVSSTPNPTDKVVLLEKAILSERQKLFSIQNQLIPPFSLSKSACLQLTNQQKIDLLDRIKSTRQEMTSLQQQITTAPKCDKITGLQKDAQKQIILLDSLQKIIKTQCQQKSILSPTIYQTNIYADGWILGDQDIDDLIEEYYQRNIRYHNITNCPLDKPFFDGQGCIKCAQPEPVFNILTKQCTHCPEDMQPDSNLRQCAWMPHYTDFQTVQNWAQQGVPIPVPQKKLLPCPPQRPYFNGKKCQVCLMPKYWSIKQNACVECPTGTLFDVNEHRCQKPQTNDLTILQGTRWVTNDCNITRIIAERVRILKQNKTSKSYKMCPVEKPFYDGIICINCANEFNIDTRKCVSSPNKTSAYDENVRCYVQKQSGFQTDPRASSYTTKTALKDSPTPNCKNATPYYDGIACIDCLDPFPIFDVDTRRCTACDPIEFYDDKQHKCLPRDKIYVSTYENQLMATPTKSIDDYHAQISQKLKDNPDALVYLCQGTQYSDFKKCFNCSANEYFNIETKKCQICDGTLNATTKVCVQKVYMYTNLNQNSTKKIVAVPTTIEQQNATINKNLKQRPNAKLCPIEKPYFDGTQCLDCKKQSFNMTSQKCVPFQCTDPLYPLYNQTADKCESCPNGTSYLESKKKCQPIVYVTNTNAIYFYIEEGDATKKKLEDQIFKLEADNVVITCDASHPYYDGKDCIDCSITRNVSQISQHKPYFNLLTLKCQACSNWDNVTHKCLDKPLTVQCAKGQVLNPKTNKCQNLVTDTDSLNNNYIEQGNATKANLIAQINKTKASEPVSVCPKATPFFSKSQGKCITCTDPTPLFNLATSNCSKPLAVQCAKGQVLNPKTNKCQNLVTDTDSLNNNYIEQGNATKANLIAQINKTKASQPISVCPKDTPFFSKSEGKCILCSDPTPYFNLATQTCKACENYNTETHICEQTIPRFKMNVEDFYGTIFTS